MKLMRKYCLSLALAMASGFGFSASAKDVTLTLDQANAVARQAFIAKDYRTANTLSYGVLQQRPNDTRALVMAAATDPSLGQAKRGWQAGRRAFKLAKDPTLKYEAAFFTASAAVSQERYNSAKYWLRQAYQAAPNDVSKARVSQIFKNVRRKSPLTVNLDFNVSPSSNINNGSREDTSYIGFFGGQAQLSADAQALSGMQYRGSAAFQYKLGETTRKRTVLNFGVDARYYSLSPSSKADLQAEDDARTLAGLEPRNVRASEFSYETLYAGVTQQVLSEDKRSSLTYGFSLGQSWYGGSSLSRFAGVNLRKFKVLTPARSIRYGLSAQRQFRLDNKRNSSNVVSLTGSVSQLIKDRGLLTVGGYVRDTNSQSNEIDNTALGLTLSYKLSKPVFAKTQLEMSMALQRAEYETSVIYGDRRDNRLSLSSTLTFSDINYYGFSPTATLSASRTNSTVDRYSTDSLGINLGLRSSF